MSRADAVARILALAALGGSGGSQGTSDYNSLVNLPSINGKILMGNLTLEDLGIDIPTNVSAFVNDANYIDEATLLAILDTIDGGTF